MLGLMAMSFPDFVIERASQNEWDAIAKLAMLSKPELEDGDALSRVIVAACEVLGLEEDTLGLSFSQYFVNTSLEECGYSQLLRYSGKSVVELVERFNDLHLYFSGGAVAAPDMWVENVLPVSFDLHVKSLSRSIAPWVIGVVEEISRLFFRLVGVQVSKLDDINDMELNSGRYHQVFKVAMASNTQGFDNPCQIRECIRVDGEGSVYGMDPQMFYTLFPFHVLVDSNCNVIQIGSGLKSLMPDLAHPGSPVSDYLKIRHPSIMTWSFPQLVHHTLATCSVLLATAHGLELKGSFVRTNMLDPKTGESQDAALFIGSPNLGGLFDMKRHGLSLADIPSFDMAADLMLAREQQQSEAVRHAQEVDSLTEDLDLAEEDVESLKEKMLDMMKKGGKGVRSEKLKCASASAMEVLDALLQVPADTPINKVVSVTELLNARDWIFQMAEVKKSDTISLESFSTFTGGDAEVNQSLMDMLSAPQNSTNPYRAQAHMAQAQLNSIMESISVCSGSSGRLNGASNRSTLVVHDLKHLEISRIETEEGALASSSKTTLTPLSTGRMDDNEIMNSLNGGLSGTFSVEPPSRPPGIPLLGGSSLFDQPLQGSSSHDPSPGLAFQNGMNTQLSEACSPSFAIVANMVKAAPPPPQLLPPRSTSNLRVSSLQMPQTTPDPSVEKSKSGKPKTGSVLMKWKSVLKKTFTSISKKESATQSSCDVSCTTKQRDMVDADHPPMLSAVNLPPVEASPIHEIQWAPIRRRARRNSAPVEPDCLNLFMGLHALGHASDDSCHPTMLQRAIAIVDAGGVPRFSSHAPTNLNISSTLVPSSPAPLLPRGPRAALKGGARLSALSAQDSSSGWASKSMACISSQLSPLSGAAGAGAGAGAGGGAGIPQASSSTNADVSGNKRRSTLSTKTISLEGLMILVKEPTDELNLCLETLDSWQFNAFALDKAANGRALSVLAFSLFHRSNVIKLLGLDATRLARFLIQVEEGYRNNPYHSQIHAADVLRTLHVICNRGDLRRLVTPEYTDILPSLIDHVRGTQQNGVQSFQGLEGKPHCPVYNLSGNEATEVRQAFLLLTVYFSAVIHDYDHRGVNNHFLVRVGDPLALLYNDVAPMENHHVASAFLILKEDRFNFIHRLPTGVKSSLRTQAIDMILATDMKQHFALASLLKAQATSVEKKILDAAILGDLNEFAADLNRAAGTSPLVHNPGSFTSMSLMSTHSSVTMNRAVGLSGSTLAAWDSEAKDGHTYHTLAPACIAPRERRRASVPSAPAGDISPQPAINSHRVLSTLFHSVSSRGSQGTLKEKQSKDSACSDASLLSRTYSPGIEGFHREDSLTGIQENPEAKKASRDKALRETEEDSKFLFWKVALKCADLGHLTSEPEVHKKWVLLLEEEMFRQGDLERKEDLPVSALMNRRKTGITKQQPGFFNAVVLPLYSTFCQCFPAIQPLMDGAQGNLKMWMVESSHDEGVPP